MPGTSFIPPAPWSEHELERAEQLVHQEFPELRPDLIAVAVRLAKRDVSPRDGMASLVALVRQTLIQRQMLMDQT